MRGCYLRLFTRGDTDLVLSGGKVYLSRNSCPNQRIKHVLNEIQEIKTLGVDSFVLAIVGDKLEGSVLFGKE